MENAFLQKADKQWADNGLLIEKAILLIQRVKRGEYITDEKYDDVLSGLLTTLMTDTPSGMFGCALLSHNESL